MPKQYLYRAHIVEYPEMEIREVWEDRQVDYGDGFVNEHREYVAQVPVLFEPDEGYIEQFGTTNWIEPDTEKWFKSRTSAKRRVEILNAVGYVAIVQRSAPVRWPEDGRERVSEKVNVAEALRIVQEAGFEVAA